MERKLSQVPHSVPPRANAAPSGARDSDEALTRKCLTFDAQRPWLHEPGSCALRFLRDASVTSVMTLTVLFSDVSRSTAIRLAVGEDRADEWFTHVNTFTRSTVEAHGGRVVKTLGDGVMAVFWSASAALAGAVGLQRRFSTQRVPLITSAPLLRIGLTSGDVLVGRDDVAGMPVIEAARLCDSARPGSIVASSIVIHLANGRGGHVSRPIGQLALTGVHQPVDAHDVDWSRTGDVPVSRTASPRSIRRSAPDRRTKRPAHDRPALSSVRSCSPSN